jgi:hypothetical protein
VTSRTFRSPLILFAFAIALFLSPAALPIWRNANPLVLALPLEPGVVVSPAFRVSHGLQYLVELEVDRALPLEELTCLLGEPLSSIPCEENQQVVHLRWRISSHGSEIAHGASAYNQGAGFGPTIAKTVGAFEGRAGQQYQLELTVLRSLRALEAAKPRMLVQLHPADTKGDVMLAVLLRLLAVALAAGSIVWLGVAWYRSSVTKPEVS